MNDECGQCAEHRFARTRVGRGVPEDRARVQCYACGFGEDMRSKGTTRRRGFPWKLIERVEEPCECSSRIVLARTFRDRRVEHIRYINNSSSWVISFDIA